MKSRNIAYALLTSILAVGWGAQLGNAQDAPKDNKDTPPARLRLSIWAPSSEAGRQLRLRVLTLSRAATSACPAAQPDHEPRRETVHGRGGGLVRPREQGLLIHMPRKVLQTLCWRKSPCFMSTRLATL